MNKTERKWRYPGNINPMKNVHCFYKTDDYRAEIYNKKIDGTWWWIVFKNEQLLDQGADYTLQKTKYQCQKLIETHRGDY